MKTKALQTLAVLAIASVAVAGSVSAATFTLYGTGDNTTPGTGVDTGQTTDASFTLVSSATGVPYTGTTSSHGYPQLIVTKTLAPGWGQHNIVGGENGGAKWISPQAAYPAVDPSGYYIYQETFNLTNYTPTTAVITGEWWADNNSVGIYLNGALENTGKVNAYNPSTGTNFNISSGFQSGINTLDFVVFNQPGSISNPTGLLVDITSSTAAIVPEPSTVAVYMVGSLALLGFVIRKKRIS